MEALHCYQLLDKGLLIANEGLFSLRLNGNYVHDNGKTLRTSPPCTGLLPNFIGK